LENLGLQDGAMTSAQDLTTKASTEINAFIDNVNISNYILPLQPPHAKEITTTTKNPNCNYYSPFFKTDILHFSLKSCNHSIPILLI
jgi:hypothetical protein